MRRREKVERGKQEIWDKEEKRDRERGDGDKERTGEKKGRK